MRTGLFDSYYWEEIRTSSHPQSRLDFGSPKNGYDWVQFVHEINFELQESYQLPSILRWLRTGKRELESQFFASEPFGQIKSAAFHHTKEIHQETSALNKCEHTLFCSFISRDASDTSRVVHFTKKASVEPPRIAKAALHDMDSSGFFFKHIQNRFYLRNEWMLAGWT
jgi:hypothetical protein